MVMTQGVRLPISSLLSQASNALRFSSQNPESCTERDLGSGTGLGLGCPDIKKKIFFNCGEIHRT